MSFWSENFFQKANEIIYGFLPFVAFWGLPGDIVSNIIHKEAYRKPPEARSPKEATKISGQKSRNNFVGFLEEVF